MKKELDILKMKAVEASYEITKSIMTGDLLSAKRNNLELSTIINRIKQINSYESKTIQDKNK